MLRNHYSDMRCGDIVAKKTKKITSYKVLLKDFFYVRQPLKYYLMTLMFLLIVFGIPIIGGGGIKGQSWLLIPLLFVKAIIFGGIEEIGWRYLFQPSLEKKLSFVLSSVITFFAWALWHMMYNYLDGTAFMLDPKGLAGFLTGLANTTFVLGCIYHITKSLWLCVFYHAMFNAFSQTFSGANLTTSIVILTICVAISIILTARQDKLSAFK